MTRPAAINMAALPAAGPSSAPLWLLAPVVLTAFLWLLTPYVTSAEPLLFAFVLAGVPAAAYVDWRQRAWTSMLPLLSLVSGMYWLYFGFTYFLGQRHLTGVSGVVQLNEDSLDAALMLACLGVLSMVLGYAAAPPMAVRTAPVISASPRASAYLCGVLGLGMVLSVVESSAHWLGGGGRQLMTLLQSFVPLVAFAYLFGRYMDGDATAVERRALVAYAAVRVLSAVASGWLGPLFGLFAVALGTYLTRRRRLPLGALLVAAVLFLFFQAGKNEFRSNYWYREDDSGKVERILFWVGESSARWNQALTNPESGRLQQILGSAIGRVSLLEQTANVLQMTPAMVPFQEGASYAYMVVSLVPRMLWPDKPSVNDANRAYQMAYGLTAERNLDNVSIAVGTMTEGYINFGWYGVAAVMAGIGFFLRVFERLLLNRASGPFLLAVGLALTPSLLVIESQMAQYLSGFVQHVIAAVAVFLPVLERAKAGGEAVPR